MKPDKVVPGLFRRPTSKGEKWVVSARIKGGNPTKVTIGDCANLSISEARTIAKKHLAAMAQGINPNTVRRLETAKGLSLRDAIEQYLSEKASRLKASTVKSYRSTLTNNFAGWMDRPINSITPQECVRRYLDIKVEVASRTKQKAKANAPGEAEALKAMRTLSSILKYFANDMLPDNTGRLLPYGNPVAGLTGKGVTTSLKPRTKALTFDNRIKLLEFLTHPSHFFNPDMTPLKVTAKTAVKADHSDWLVILLCTGLRRNEPLKMMWDDVDFELSTFTVTDTKNGKPLTLPMTKRVERIFTRRWQEGQSISELVFPQRNDPSKPATMNRVTERISKLSGIEFTAHDLRRTAATALNELGFSVEDIGRILNHSKKTVTEEYIQTSTEHLREALQQLECLLFDEPSADISNEPIKVDWD